jgi:hypothetical protein
MEVLAPQLAAYALKARKVIFSLALGDGLKFYF